MIRCVIGQVPTFGFNRPLVRRIYDEIGFDIVKIRSGMTARDLALAGGHAEVAALLPTAKRSTQ